MNVKLLLTSATSVMPKTARKGDAGMDCYANEFVVIEHGHTKKVPLGFSVELPEGFEMQVRGRSSMSLKGILCHTGTIDSGYRGEVSAIITNLGPDTAIISRGDRIAQVIITHYVGTVFMPVASLNESERGTAGFGSTGV
jgi:dUTP pyrophosphatase